jgi:protein-L-isoaspartate(D-aspartate) O-methyltransferase
MTDTAAPLPELAEPGPVRQAMTDRLLAEGWITSGFVEAAFRTVPREVFAPLGTALADAYPGDKAVITKKDANGRNISSISAPWLQARMIGQAALRPGMKVLEVGSGGCNAAILAEVVGRSGHVISVDIDPEITGRAVAALDMAGYNGRVTVVTADAEHGVPEFAPYDAIIVTVGAWDVPPAWREQVAGDGALVVPLRMNSVSRSIGFSASGDHWQSASAQVCGFVPIQGIGARPEQTFRLPHPGGGSVVLRFEDWAPDDIQVASAVLGSAAAAEWSGVTVGNEVSFADLQLWLAGRPGYCRIGAEDGAVLAGDRSGQGRGRGWFPFAVLDRDTFAYLGLRPVPDSDPPLWEFGAFAYGPRGEQAAAAFAAEIRKWDQTGRDVPSSAFGYWPAESTANIPSGAVIFPKAHGAATVDWGTRT